ncbi:MAG: VanZ family protein [Spirochaetota bacterium]
MSKHSLIIMAFGGLFVACTLLIGVFSLLPPSEVETAARFNDKLLHGIAYAALGWCTYGLLFSLRRPTGRVFTLVVISLLYCIAFGAIIEYVQPLTGRSMEGMDLVFDALGALVGTISAALMLYWWEAHTTDRAGNTQDDSS